MEIHSGISHLEDSLAISSKVRHSFTIRPRNHVLDIYPTDLKTYVHKITYP